MKITFPDGTTIESRLPAIKVTRRTREECGVKVEEVTYTEMVGP